MVLPRPAHSTLTERIRIPALAPAPASAPTASDNNNLQATQLALDAVRAASPYGTQLSKADMYVLGATLAIELASTPAASPYAALFSAADNPMASSVSPLALPFVTGRVDVASCVGDSAMLPATSFLWADIAALFSGRFGMTAAEIVALFGAHSLGRVNVGSPVTGNVQGLSWNQASSSFSTAYFSVLLNGRQGWFLTSNTTGTLTPAGGSSGTSSDAWAMLQAIPGGARGPGSVADVHLLMLRTDVELGVNTTSTYQAAAGGPSRSNPCGAFALSMMPAGTSAGQGAGSLTAAQNASCPRRAANLATMAAFLQDTAAWYASFATAWAKLTRGGYATGDLCEVGAAACTASGGSSSGGSGGGGSGGGASNATKASAAGPSAGLSVAAAAAALLLAGVVAAGPELPLASGSARRGRGGR